MFKQFFKQSFFILLLSIFAVSCSTSKTGNKNTSQETASEINQQLTDQLADIFDDAIKLNNHPGKVTFLSFPYYGPYKKEKLICDGKEVYYYTDQNLAKAYLAESYFSDRKNYQCHFEYINELGEEKKLLISEVKITKFKYPFDRLDVDKKRVFLSKKDKARVRRERKLLNKLYSKKVKHPLFTEPFMRPLDSYITSVYGTRRLFNNKKSTQHLGVDFRAKIGTPIPVANKGKVVFAGELFYSGNTVLVDHGLGIFTYYAHLSKIKATVGEFVPKGAIIGLAGMSGRVNGPHLHWGVNLNGDFVDGNSLVDAGH